MMKVIVTSQWNVRNRLILYFPCLVRVLGRAIRVRKLGVYTRNHRCEAELISIGKLYKNLFTSSFKICTVSMHVNSGIIIVSLSRFSIAASGSNDWDQPLAVGRAPSYRGKTILFSSRWWKKWLFQLTVGRGKPIVHPGYSPVYCSSGTKIILATVLRELLMFPHVI